MVLLAAGVFVVAVRMCLDGRLRGNQLFEHVDELFKSGVAREELFDLGTKFRTFPSCLLVRKYVIVVLHDVFLESFGGIIPFIRSCQPVDSMNVCGKRSSAIS